jgi:CRISPR-associated protein Csd2
MADSIKNRYDFVLLFDVTDGNPNGDPDAGNLPRIDPETGTGIITDVCLKRKVRNYVQLVKGGIKPYDIFIREKAILNSRIEDSYSELSIDLSKDPVSGSDGKKRNRPGQGQGKEIERVRDLMCKNYYDIRTFGAVLTTGANAGQVRGPVQLTFGRSQDPVVALEHGITRVARTTPERSETGGAEMGRKYTIPYALYRAHGFISSYLAAGTGFGDDDLDLFWESLRFMFEHDHSAARGMMSARRLLVFRHASLLGNAPAHRLFDLVRVAKADKDKPARCFDDYVVTVSDNVPSGIEILDMV